jgi:hypothetical protein
MGLLSLLAYWWAQEHYGILVAAVIGVVGTLLEAAWEYKKRRQVSKMTWAGIPLVLIFGLSDWAAEYFGSKYLTVILSELLMTPLLFWAASGMPPKFLQWSPELGAKLSSDPQLFQFQALRMKKTLIVMAAVFGAHLLMAVPLVFLTDSIVSTEFSRISVLLPHFINYGAWLLLAFAGAWFIFRGRRLK